MLGHVRIDRAVVPAIAVGTTARGARLIAFCLLLAGASVVAFDQRNAVGASAAAAGIPLILLLAWAQLGLLRREFARDWREALLLLERVRSEKGRPL